MKKYMGPEGKDGGYMRQRRAKGLDKPQAVLPTNYVFEYHDDYDAENERRWITSHKGEVVYPHSEWDDDMIPG